MYFAGEELIMKPFICSKQEIDSQSEELEIEIKHGFYQYFVQHCCCLKEKMDFRLTTECHFLDVKPEDFSDYSLKLKYRDGLYKYKRDGEMYTYAEAEKIFLENYKKVIVTGKLLVS